MGSTVLFGDLSEFWGAPGDDSTQYMAAFAWTESTGGKALLEMATDTQWTGLVLLKGSGRPARGPSDSLRICCCCLGCLSPFRWLSQNT